MERVKCPECGLKIRKDWAGKRGVVCTRVGHVYKKETDIPVQGASGWLLACAIVVILGVIITSIIIWFSA